MSQADKALSKWIQQFFQIEDIKSEIKIQIKKGVKYEELALWIKDKVMDKIGVNPILTLHYEYKIKPDVTLEALNLKETWMYKESWLPFKDGSLILIKEVDPLTELDIKKINALETSAIAKKILKISEIHNRQINLLKDKMSHKIVDLNPDEAKKHLMDIKSIINDKDIVLNIKLGQGHFIEPMKAAEILSDYLKRD